MTSLFSHGVIHIDSQGPVSSPGDAWSRDLRGVFFGPDTYRYTSALKRVLGPHGGLRRPGAIEMALCCPDATVYAAECSAASWAAKATRTWSASRPCGCMPPGAGEKAFATATFSS